MVTMDLARLAFVGTALIFLTAFSPPPPPPEEPAMGDCENHDPLKRVYWGDTHVHTTLSLDAAQHGVRKTPDQAYQYAKDHQNLDFVGLSDHSEYLAETDVCFNKDSLAYFGPYCTFMRGSKSGATVVDTVGFLLGAGTVGIEGGRLEFVSVCTLFPALCRDRLNEVWAEVQASADRHYAPYNGGGCGFTTFVGYEWTGSPGFDNEHRNVFFKDENVPQLPTSFFEAPTPEELWARLDAQCHSGNDCEVLTIPHNSNLGGGEMFNPTSEGSLGSRTPYSYDLALQRARMEPLVEIYQHKGASECTVGKVPYASNDEFCAFELVKPEICEAGEGWTRDGCTPLCSDYQLLLGGSFTGACVEPSDFIRSALRRGLAEQRRIGANPFQFGFIGSTDTHNGTPGDTAEKNWQGGLGNNDDELRERIGTVSFQDNAIVALAADLIPGVNAMQGFGQASVYSPGGLAAVWSEQNSRHALFEAMQRREAFGTSGTRITLRTFTGPDVPANICSQSSFARAGYSSGVPMGGELLASSNPTKVAVSAMMAPDSMPLQRVQVVKGWIDGNGETHEKVYNVAGDLTDYGSDPGVDLNTCASTRSSGYTSMCVVWQDPDFDAQESAFYYTRVLENPSCRWSKMQCNDALVGKSEAEIDLIAADPEHPLHNCVNGSMPETIQERAWSSPVWYQAP